MYDKNPPGWNIPRSAPSLKYTTACKDCMLQYYLKSSI